MAAEPPNLVFWQHGTDGPEPGGLSRQTERNGFGNDAERHYQ
nr:MAG TPA: hypothetical protein [Caudoviricetes sp.]